ncbi:MAG: hypothetical protein HC827_07725 [Cyanobacteria bacterium RM1_2_2]|nr:hypothetical protein [Cyanobacteria bacterium RM1_2_2]
MAADLEPEQTDLGSWIESIRKLDGRAEQINGLPAIDLIAKPAPTHDRTD